MQVGVLSGRALQEDGLPQVLLNRVVLSDLDAFLAAGPVAEQAHLEMLVFVLTTSALLLELPKLEKIVGRFKDKSLDHVLVGVKFQLALEFVLGAAEIIIYFVVELYHFLREAVFVLVDFGLQLNVVQIVDNVELELVVVIVENIGEVVGLLEGVAALESQAFGLPLGEYQ